MKRRGRYLGRSSGWTARTCMKNEEHDAGEANHTSDRMAVGEKKSSRSTTRKHRLLNNAG